MWRPTFGYLRPGRQGCACDRRHRRYAHNLNIVSTATCPGQIWRSGLQPSTCPKAWPWPPSGTPPQYLEWSRTSLLEDCLALALPEMSADVTVAGPGTPQGRSQGLRLNLANMPGQSRATPLPTAANEMKQFIAIFWHLREIESKTVPATQNALVEGSNPSGAHRCSVVQRDPSATARVRGRPAQFEKAYPTCDYRLRSVVELKLIFYRGKNGPSVYYCGRSIHAVSAT
jgi:hypothetical protein